MRRFACALLLALVACGDPGRPDATPPGAGATPAVQRCSASQLSPDLGDQDLPEAVARMREDIAAAAVACDYDALERLALAGGGDDGFTFSFGAPERGPAAFWRDIEESDVEEGTSLPLAMLVELLGTEPDVSTQGPTIYTWPAVAVHEQPTDEDWAKLEGVFPDDRLEAMKRASREQGIGYLDYRIGITESGDWIFFVAGD